MSRLLVPVLLLHAACADVRSAPTFSPDLRDRSAWTREVPLTDADMDITADGTIVRWTPVGDLSSDAIPDLAVLVDRGTDAVLYLVNAPIRRHSKVLPDDAWATIDDPDRLFVDGALIRLGDDHLFPTDGFVISAPGAVTDDGRIYVFADPLPDGTVSLQDATAILKGAADQRAGAALASADVDGDGLVDLVVGAPAPGGVGRVYVVPAPFVDGSLPQVATTTFEGSAPWGDGTSVAILDDENADGKPDIAWGAPDYFSSYGMVCLGLSPFSVGTRLADNYTIGDGHLGRELSTADVDGDGHRDLIGRADFAVAVWTDIATQFASFSTGSELTQSMVPATAGDVRAVPIGDMNADGFADMLVTVPAATDPHVMLAYGPLLDGDIDIAAWDVFDARFPDATAGATAGDVDRDGWDDFVLLGTDGALHVFFGDPEDVHVADLGHDASWPSNPSGDWMYTSVARDGTSSPLYVSDSTAELYRWLAPLHPARHPQVTRCIAASGCTVHDVRYGAGALVLRPGEHADAAVQWTAPIDGHCTLTMQWQSARTSGVRAHADVSALWKGVEFWTGTVDGYHGASVLESSAVGMLSAGDVIELRVAARRDYRYDAVDLKAHLDCRPPE